MLSIHCFHGVACFIEDDFNDEKRCRFINAYDKLWNLNPFQIEYPNTSTKDNKPESIHIPIFAAQELAKEIDFFRVDLMLIGKVVFFSEITLSSKREILKIMPAI